MSDEQRRAPVLQRAAQLQTMLDRTTGQGEPSLHYTAAN
jgi:hypothetical protein